VWLGAAPFLSFFVFCFLFFYEGTFLLYEIANNYVSNHGVAFLLTLFPKIFCRTKKNKKKKKPTKRFFVAVSLREWSSLNSLRNFIILLAVIT